MNKPSYEISTEYEIVEVNMFEQLAMILPVLLWTEGDGDLNEGKWFVSVEDGDPMGPHESEAEARDMALWAPPGFMRVELAACCGDCQSPEPPTAPAKASN